MKRDVIFISVQAVYIAGLNDALLLAIDVDGQIWSKLAFGQSEWSRQPATGETVH